MGGGGRAAHLEPLLCRLGRHGGDRAAALLCAGAERAAAQAALEGVGARRGARGHTCPAINGRSRAYRPPRWYLPGEGVHRGEVGGGPSPRHVATCATGWQVAPRPQHAQHTPPALQPTSSACHVCYTRRRRRARRAGGTAAGDGSNFIGRKNRPVPSVASPHATAEHAPAPSRHPHAPSPCRRVRHGPVELVASLSAGTAAEPPRLQGTRRRRRAEAQAHVSMKLMPANSFLTSTCPSFISGTG